MDVFFEVSLILVIAALMAFVMQLLRQPLLIGHILTGILVGPLVLNLIHSTGTIELFSRLGITSLLFIVGLGLSPRVLREVGKASLVAGLGQVLFTALVGFSLCRILNFSWMSSFYIALALTFSSTIIVTKFLSDRRDTEKLYGKIAIGILLVQDFVATILLVLFSSEAKSDALQSVLFSIGKGIGLMVLVAVIGSWILPKLTRFFAASQEFLFLGSIGWGLGCAALFSFLGFSPEIGALAAGVALAASPYHYEISSKMRLLRDFFLVLFFVLLGSQLSFQGVQSLMIPALILSVFVVIGNPLIVMILMGCLGYNKKTGFLTGLAIGQVSEFSFLLVVLGIRAGQISAEILPLVTMVGLMSIAISAYLFRASSFLYEKLAPILVLFERHTTKRENFHRERYEAILFGCHRVGGDFLPLLKQSHLKYLVVDFDPAVIERLTAQHVPCRYGDAEDNEFLDELDFTKARFIVSTLPDFEANAFLLAKARKASANSVVILMAHGTEEAILLYQAGATYVVMPHFLGGNYASLLFEKFGADPKKFVAERTKHLKHLKGKMRLAGEARLGLH